MSLLRFLGLGNAKDTSTSDTASVRRIVDALERMEPDAARRLARFAYVLGRVARADLAVTADETQAMERIVIERGGLPEAQAVVVVQIAKSQNALFGSTDDYLVTRELAATATREESSPCSTAASRCRQPTGTSWARRRRSCETSPTSSVSAATT
jgi:hypothetical protein